MRNDDKSAPMREYMRENNVLLKVEGLKQYFKMGHKELKAVDDVSFEVKKGEVFGIVGESGCGKTTTGRSIIRLYDITGGSIYFEGQRIAAGTRTYRDELKRLRREYNAQSRKLKKLAAECKKIGDTDGEELKNGELSALRADFEGQAAALHGQIASAKYDHAHCNREYAEERCAEIDALFRPQLDAAASEEERAEIEKRYRDELRLAKKDRITNKIQMIFQDPIASLNPRMTVREIISEGLIIRGIRDKKYIDELYENFSMGGDIKEPLECCPEYGKDKMIEIANKHEELFEISLPKDYISLDAKSNASVAIQSEGNTQTYSLYNGELLRNGKEKTKVLEGLVQEYEKNIDNPEILRERKKIKKMYVDENEMRKERLSASKMIMKYSVNEYRIMAGQIPKMRPTFKEMEKRARKEYFFEAMDYNLQIAKEFLENVKDYFRGD